MTRKTQRYSKEFWTEAVKTVLEQGLSISQGASRLSVPEGTLGPWITAARKGLIMPPESRSVAELESEVLACLTRWHYTLLTIILMSKTTG